MFKQLAQDKTSGRVQKSVESQPQQSLVLLNNVMMMMMMMMIT